MRGLVLLLLFAAIGHGQSFNTLGEGVTVSGVVVDSNSDSPLRGAEVYLRLNGDGDTRRTDSGFDGRFIFEGVPPGDHDIGASKGGYDRYRRTLRVPAGGEPLRGLRLEMGRFGVITGRVRDAGGRPVINAEVQIFQRTFQQGQALFFQAGQRQRTDDRGVYRLWGIQPGEYVVGVTPSSTAGVPGELTWQEESVFYPEVAMASEAERLPIAWGDIHEGVDFVLGPAPETEALVTLAPDWGGGCEVGMVEIFRAEPAGLVRISGHGFRNEGLTIRGLAAGLYKLNGWCRRREEPRTSAGVADLTIEEGRLTGVGIKILSPRSLAGRIVLDGLPPDSGVETPLRVAVQIRPADVFREFGPPPDGGADRLDMTGKEASFELAAFPGLNQISTNFETDSAYPAEVLVGGRPVSRGRLLVPEEGSLEEVTLIVRFNTGAVEITADLPAEYRERLQARAGLLPEPYSVQARNLDLPATKGFESAVPAGGVLLREGIPPGRYQIVLRPPGAKGDLDDPELARRLGNGVKEIEVRPGQTTRLTLQASPE